MVVLHIVHGALALVFLHLLGDAVRDISLLQESVSDIFFIRQDVVDDGGRPGFYTLCGRDIFLVQFSLDLPQRTAVQIPVINPLDDLGFLRDDLRLPIRTLAVSQHLFVLEGHFSGFRTFCFAPSDILAQRFGFRLGETAEQGDQKLAGFRQRIDVLFFEVHADAVGFQKAHCFQAVHGVSGKAGERFCDDEVDMSSFTGTSIGQREI